MNLKGALIGCFVGGIVAVAVAISIHFIFSIENPLGNFVIGFACGTIFCSLGTAIGINYDN